jgi:hypothetical protein
MAIWRRTPSYNVSILLPIDSFNVRVEEMDRYLREHEAYIRRCLEEDNPGTDWASLLAFHRTSWLSCSMSG